MLLRLLLLTFSLNKTPLGETGWPGNPCFLITGYLGIQFFLVHPPFPTQSVRLPFVTYPSLCSTCVTYRMPCHFIGHLVLLTQPLPREAGDFLRGEKYFKHVPLLAYLIYFSPKEIYMVDSIYMPKPPHSRLISHHWL